MTYTAEEAAQLAKEGESRIDRARVLAMTEEELEASIDIEEEGQFEDWALVDDPLTTASRADVCQIDDDVISWFASKDRNYVQRINDVLRDYIKSQELHTTAAD